MLYACVSSSKCGVRDIFERESLEVSVGRVQQKAKPKAHGPTLEKTRPDHAIRSGITLSCDILKKKKKKKKNNKKEKCYFLKIFFLRIIKLSGLVIVHTASSLAQEHSKSIL